MLTMPPEKKVGTAKKKIKMGTRAANVLRAVVAGARDKRQVRARLERAWDGLSRAQKIALGGTLAAIGGGFMLRAGLKGPSAAQEPAPVIAELRSKLTEDLLTMFAAGNHAQKDAIARFCVCRVHDVRGLLLDDGFKASARRLLTRLKALLSSEREDSPSRDAQLAFIERALSKVTVVDVEINNKAVANARSMVDSGREFTEGYEKEIRKLQWEKEQIQDERGQSRTLQKAIETVDARGYHPQYGHIATWDVREITGMWNAFECKSYGDLDLSFWDTRKVETMHGAFSKYKGNVEVGMWDTRSVTTMAYMFHQASDFNCDIGSWDTSSVTRMPSMFHGAVKFNRDLSTWNLRSLKEARCMFSDSAIDENYKPPIPTGFGMALRAYV